MTGVCKGLADRQTESGSLDEVVDLEEAFEDLGLTLLGHTVARVLTIDVQSLSLFSFEGSGLLAISQFDMSLMGVLDGIGKEVGDDLRHAVGIDFDIQRVVGIVLLEFHTRFLHSRSQRFEELVECLREIHVDGFDAHLPSFERGGCQDVVHQAQQHVAVVLDDLDDLFLLLRRGE